MEGSPSRPESREDYKEILGRMTLYRHGDTTYSGQYPDLTEEGKEKLEKAGKLLKGLVDEETEDLLFVHSPSARAKASMAHLLHGMDKTKGIEQSDVEEIARAYAPLRSVERANHEESGKMVADHMATFPEGVDSYVEFDRVYASHDDFENSPHWEARSVVEQRGERLLRRAVTSLIKNYDAAQKVPHIIAVSHFEVLNNIATKIFGLDIQNDDPYLRGERISIEVKGKEKNEKRALLSCEFRGVKKDAWFDVGTGAITPLE